MPRDWDARSYDRVADPMTRWGQAVLDRLPLAGDERVMDAGCGTGRVTELLAERLPRGRVVALDGSPAMIEAARGRLERFGERVEYVVADLGRPLPVAELVDAVFSTATFHWVPDHDGLFQNLAAVTRPGGRLVAQCGGRGNVAGWVRAVQTAAATEPFAAHVAGFTPWNFYGPEETEERLGAAGFEQIDCWLEEMAVVIPDDPMNYVSVVGLAAHNERLPAELHEPFSAAVVEAFEKPVELRYVRLNIDASRPGE